MREFAKTLQEDRRLRSLLVRIRGSFLFGLFLFRVGGDGGGIDKLFLRLIHILLLAPRGIIGSLFRAHDVCSLPSTVAACHPFERSLAL
jgi:hypothetical protein